MGFSNFLATWELSLKNIAYDQLEVCRVYIHTSQFQLSNLELTFCNWNPVFHYPCQSYKNMFFNSSWLHRLGVSKDFHLLHFWWLEFILNWQLWHCSHRVCRYKGICYMLYDLSFSLKIYPMLSWKFAALVSILFGRIWNNLIYRLIHI